MRCIVSIVCAVTFWAWGSAQAVLVYNGTSSNLSAPGDDPGWDAVGTIHIGTPSNSPATAIFLGNNDGYAWFLTANHVSLGGATLTIGGNPYTAFSGTAQIGTVDLKVFRLNTTVTGITPVTLASSVPSVDAAVTMIGNGKTGTKVTWDISGTSTWTSPGSDAEGYTWSDPNVKRWGTNTVLARNISTGSGNLLVTDFDATTGEAQGSLGDSGGAVFHKSGADWQLAALIISVGRIEGGTLYGNNFVDQPSSTAVASITGSPNNKSTTYAVQIADYRTLILDAIPEPGIPALVVFSTFLVAAVFLSRRHSQRFC